MTSSAADNEHSRGAAAPSSPGPWRWHLAVPVVTAAAGILLASGAISAGADPRAGSRTELPDLIRAQERQVLTRTQQVAKLRGEVEALSRAAGGEAGAAQQTADQMSRAAGLEPVSGRGVSLTLDDSPRDPADPALPAGTRPDDLVVHEQDLQGIVNALWAGGATAVGVMDQRLVATSAVRCAGNVLYLHGRTYAPPFTVRAVGDPDRLKAALDAEPTVQTYRDYVALVGLGYELSEGEIDLPGFEGPLSLTAARRRSSPTPSAPPS